MDPFLSFPQTGLSGLWVRLDIHFILMFQEAVEYLASHPLQDKADGKPVVMLPLVLFADDTSGNHSKKWHKFESWYLKLAGLPHGIGIRLENVHFVCSSD